MRDFETIIRELNLPAHFKKHPPFVDGNRAMDSRGLRALIMGKMTVRELDLLRNRIDKDNWEAALRGEAGAADTPERKAFENTVDAIWQDMEALAERTLDEGRMKPEKLYALQDDETKTVFDVWKVLHDLEQGGRGMQSGLSASINKLTKERDELKAKCAKLEDALRAAQIALAEKISTH